MENKQSNKKKYDSGSIESIVEYASHLVGHTLREVTGCSDVTLPKKRRGSFGSALEEYFFEIDANSKAAPDFEEVGLELKSTPMKRLKNGEFRAKERLVITMINYHEVVHETFETSHFMKKAASILLVIYFWEEDISNPVDYKITYSGIFPIPKEDLAQFKADWEKVVEKVRAGRAETISGADTLYLEACTKGASGKSLTSQPYSNVLAKPRAWAIKPSYMTAQENALLNKYNQIIRKPGETTLDLTALIRTRFEPYFGCSEVKLANMFHISHSKNRCARITRGILSGDTNKEIEELKKADIQVKTIRLKRNGTPAESLSFSTFSYLDIVKQSFEESNFYQCLTHPFLFILYRQDKNNIFRLSDVCIWQMDDTDLLEAQRCYEVMQENVKAGRADVSVKSSENRCCHVRPHARNKQDTYPQPYGPPVAKKCFWLNSAYLKYEIEKALS